MSAKDKKEETYKSFISYFQKVITVGIETCHKEYTSAEEEAKIIFDSKNPEKCFFDETEWELTDTVVHNPEVKVEFTPSLDEKSVNLMVDFNKNMRQKIATVFEKNVDELTSEDISRFITMSLEHTIESYS